MIEYERGIYVEDEIDIESSDQVHIDLLKLHAGQQLIIDNAKRFNVINCGRRFGKTELAIDIAINAVLDGLSVAYWTPTDSDSDEVWEALTSILDDIIVKKNESKKRVSFVTGGKIHFFSFKSPNRGRGKKYHIVLGDEVAFAEDVLEAWRKVIRATLTDYRGSAFLFSTPVKDTDFETIYTYEKTKGNWKSFHMPSHSNPTLSLEELDEIKAELPDDVFRQEYLAEFVDFNGKNFVQYYDKAKNVVREYLFDPRREVHLCFDFNVSNTIYAIQKRYKGHKVNGFNVIRQYVGELVDLEGVCKMAKLDFPGSILIINGDASGNSRSATSDNNLSAYELIRTYLKLSLRSFNVPKVNPSHRYSYIHCNAVFKNCEWTIHESCDKLINDVEKVKVVTEKGKFEIDKSNPELTHYLDAGLRYFINAEMRDILRDVEIKD